MYPGFRADINVIMCTNIHISLGLERIIESSSVFLNKTSFKKTSCDIFLLGSYFEPVFAHVITLHAVINKAHPV